MHTLKVILGGFLLLAVCPLLGRWIGGAAATVVGTTIKYFLVPNIPTPPASTNFYRLSRLHGRPGNDLTASYFNRKLPHLHAQANVREVRSQQRSIV
jgi:hypothetical protein